MKFWLTKSMMRYLLTFRRLRRTEPIPERLEDRFFQAIESLTGLDRETAELALHHVGKIETIDFVFLREYGDTRAVIAAD